MKRRLILALLVTCATPGSLPSDAETRVTRSFTVDNGLPSSQIFGMTQDSSGRIWFASSSGIVPFDGQEWETVGSYPGLPSREYQFLRSDSEGTIWAVSPGSQALLATHDGRAWTTVQAPEPLVSRHYKVTAFDVTSADGATEAAMGTAWQDLWIWKDGT